MIRWFYIAILITMATDASAQFGTPRDLAFWGSKRSVETFTPEELTNMVWWVDIYTKVTNSVGTSPPANTDSLLSWGDRTTNNRTFWFTNLQYKTTGGPSNGPSFEEPSPLSSGAFMGSGHFLQTNTLFMVQKSPAAPPAVLAYYFSSTNVTYRNDFRLDNVYSHSAYAGSTATFGTVATDTWFVWCVEFAGAGSRAWTNGVQFGSIANAGTDGCAGALLGAINTSPSYDNEGKFVEGLFYNNALSSNDIYRVSRYLGLKHGITIP